MLLGKAGLLYERRATTHWRSLGWMRESFPDVTVVEDQHVVEDGHLITSTGISAGIDLALRVVARYHGEEVARATARHMEYRYPDGNRRRVEVPGRKNGRWWDRWFGVSKRRSRQ
jgi:transcriptional regulator GlxA family with amidase domain